MRTKPTPALHRHAFVVWLGRLAQALLAPAAALDNVALRHKSRLLAILLLTMIALFALVDITRILTMPGYQPPWYGYLLFGGAYALNRTRCYRLAAGLTIAAFPLIIFTAIVSNPAYGLSRTVQYLVLSLFLASIFMSWRGLAVLAAINSAGLLLLPILLPMAIPTYTPIVTPLAVNTIGAALALIFMRHRDQVERERQAQLRASEERLRLALDAARMGTWDWDLLADVIVWSEHIAGLFGLPPSAYPTTRAAYLELIHPSDRAAVKSAITALLIGVSSDYHVAHRVLWPDGSLRWLEVQGRVYRDAMGRSMRMAGTILDITARKQTEAERERLEQQLGHAQKMEAIGRLAGGIAHDFNNLLTVILGNVELLLEALTDGDRNDLRRDAEQIWQATKRAVALTRQLLAFSRRQVLEPRHLDLNTILADMGQLLKRLIGEDIELAIELAPDLGTVLADPGQIEQVIMNLAVNARDAMPEGGRLTIEAANVAVYDAYAREHLGAERGPYIMLTISDTGAGMDAATRAQIFEPFFTTKAVGKGTGLGLATVHGIVTQSGGHIRVDSEPGHGTTFKIYLPRVDAAEESTGADGLLAESRQGDATILLVEDEPALRDLAGRVLRGYGYHVLEAEDGPTALQVAAAHPGPIDLLLTDVIMSGGLSGRQLAEQVVAQRPAIKVLYMSGYSNTMMTQALFDPGQAFVEKPFTPTALARKVWDILQV